MRNHSRGHPSLEALTMQIECSHIFCQKRRKSIVFSVQCTKLVEAICSCVALVRWLGSISAVGYSLFRKQNLTRGSLKHSKQAGIRAPKLGTILSKAFLSILSNIT
eukprot:2436518-Amphidinium_carterae.1